MIKRHLQKELEKRIIQSDYDYNSNQSKNRPAIILYGPRQTGKTTLVNEIVKKYLDESKYINCELIYNKVALEASSESSLKSFLGNKKIIVLEEAQKISNIDIILKTIVDKNPEIQVIATASSSFELINKKMDVLENSYKYLLYPFSLQELCNDYDINSPDFIKNILRFGMYPDVFITLNSTSEEETKYKLDDILSNYLFRDILELENLKRSDLILKLLQTLALQVGKELSLNELATMLEVNNHTLARYIYLLEQNFIIFSLSSLSRNLKKEIGKKYKFYFYDLGIRNSIIQNLNILDIRTDTEALWENFCLVERLKYNQSVSRSVNQYFWRTYDGQEVDYIEEAAGKLEGYKFKWSKEIKAFRPPKAFIDSYENSSVKKIDQDIYLDFLSEKI